MRLPRVGEEGWQVRSLVGRFEGYRDCQVLDFSSTLPAWGLHGTAGLNGCDGPFYLTSVDGLDRERISPIHTFRRKPEQKDNQAAHNTFQEIMDSLMGRVKGKTEVVK